MILLTRQCRELYDIVESSPVAYGLDSGIWTSPIIAHVIEEEYGILYHPGHVRKLLHKLGFSVQRPKRILALADKEKQDEVFNASTYLSFLKEIAPRYRRRGAILIQDNASYHKDSAVGTWFKNNRGWLEVHQLPPYPPEFNPTERLWQHTRKNGTHNRYFFTVDDLRSIMLRVFTEMQSRPSSIRGYLTPFCA